MIETSLGARRSVVVLAMTLSLWTATPVDADILIVSSNTPGLKPGMQLAENAQLEVPAGAKVRLLLPSGATLSVYGPASRPVKDVTKGEPIVESVWAKAKEMLATGGVDQSRPGATRSIVVTPPPPPTLAWNIVSASASGNVCVEKGARLMLVRPAGGGAREATLTDKVTNASASIAWPDKVIQAEWPMALAPNAAATYQIATAGAAMREIRLRLIDKSELGDATALRALLQNDCQQQARAWAQ